MIKVTYSVFVVILNYNGYADTMECVEKMRKNISKLLLTTIQQTTVLLF